MRRWFVATLSSIVLGLFCADAAATTVVRVGILEMICDADIIFHGRLERILSVKSKEKNIIFTDYLFSVSSYYKGEREVREVWLQVPGGRLGGEETVVEGMPHFGEEDVGGEFVIMGEVVSVEGGGRYLPYGLGQGVFRVRGGYLERGMEGHLVYGVPWCTGGEAEARVALGAFYTELRRQTIACGGK